MIGLPRAVAIGCFLGSVLLGVPPARADLGDACPGRYEGAAGPLAGGTQAEQPADFGAVPEACPATELSLRLRGELADHSDAPDFSGNIVAGTTLRARRRLSARGWVSFAVDLVTYRYFDNAGLVGTGTSFGPATLGYHLVLLATARTSIAAYARGLLPIDTGRQGGGETGLELGGAGRVRPSRRWVLDGGLSLGGRLDLTGGVARGSLSPTALAEAWFSPKPSFAVVAGGSVFLHAAPTYTLWAVTPRVGLRGALRHGLWLAFLAEAPLAGDEATQAIASVFVGWTP